MNTRSSFRLRMTNSFSKPKNSSQEIVSFATPMRSTLTRRGSVEVISDVELTSVEGKNGDFALKRKKSVKARRCINKTLATISYMSQRFEPEGATQTQLDKVEWRRVHMVVADAILAYSDPKTFILESRISMDAAKIREVRHRGRGAVRILLADSSVFYIRFRDREERRKWLVCLQDQAVMKERGAKRARPESFQSVTPPIQSSRTSILKIASKSELKNPRRRSAISFVSSALLRLQQKTQDVKKRISMG